MTLRELPGFRKGLLLAALCLGALAWHVWADREEISRFFPHSYSARVNDFIQRGLVTADCSADRPRIEFHADRAQASEREWYQTSYLKSDLDRFNLNPQASRSFTLEIGCRLRAISPGLHAIDLPFHPRHPWEGDIRWADEAPTAQLASSSRTLLLHTPSPTSREDAAETQVGTNKEVEGAAAYIRFAKHRSQPAAYIHPVGDAPGAIVVQNNVMATSGLVRVTGRSLPFGRIAYLQPGDWLSFSPSHPASPSEVFLVRENQGKALASSLVLRNDKAERISPDPGLGLVPAIEAGEDQTLLAVLTRSIDTMLAREPEAVAVEQARAFDLDLTLSSQLQRRVTQALGAFCRFIERSQQLSHDFPAGAAVMNGKTGELLALATFPGGAQLAARGAADVRSRRRLLLNQNFVRHPIGSAGKPFFFAAIAQQYPILMQLKLQPHGTNEVDSYNDLLQCHLPRGYDDHRHPYEVDFRTALEVSCNRYTLFLATLALAADPDAGDSPLAQALPRDPDIRWPPTPGGSPVRFGDQPLSFAPALKYIVEDELPRGTATTAVRECDALRSLDQVRYQLPLHQITGVETYLGAAPPPSEEADNREFARSYAATRSKWDLWKSLVDSMSQSVESGRRGAFRQEVAASLQAVSPEEVNLGFNAVTSLRDYVNILLGGSSSSWSNVQLAESLSRLVTGRQVRARLLQAVRPRGADKEAETAPPPPELPLRDDVRREVLSGMRQVVMGEHGTARRLRPSLQLLRDQVPGRDLFIFSKTGSPRIEHGIPNDLAPALDSLVAGYLTFTNDQIVFRDGGASCCAAHDDAFRTQLTQATRKMSFRPALAAQLYTILRSFSARHQELSWSSQREVPARLGSPLYLLGGRLTVNHESPRLQQRVETDDGGVYIFSLVSLPHASGHHDTDVPDVATLAAPDARVVTVALHLETGHNNSGLAVDAASSLLPSLAPLLR